MLRSVFFFVVVLIYTKPLFSAIPTDEYVRKSVIAPDLAEQIIARKTSFFFENVTQQNLEDMMNLLCEKTTDDNVTELADAADQQIRQLYLPEMHDFFKHEILFEVLRNLASAEEIINFVRIFKKFWENFIDFDIPHKNWSDLIREVSAIDRDLEQLGIDLGLMVEYKQNFSVFREDYATLYALKKILSRRTGQQLREFLAVDFSPLLEDIESNFLRAQIVEDCASSPRNAADLRRFIETIQSLRPTFLTQFSDPFHRNMIVRKLVLHQVSCEELPARVEALVEMRKTLITNGFASFDQARIYASLLSSWRNATEISEFCTFVTNQENCDVLFSFPANPAHCASVTSAYADSKRSTGQILSFAQKFKALRSEIITPDMRDVSATCVQAAFARSSLAAAEIEPFVIAVTEHRDKFFTPPMDGQYRQEIWEELLKAKLKQQDVVDIADKMPPFPPSPYPGDLYAAYDHKKIIVQTISKRNQ